MIPLQYEFWLASLVIGSCSLPVVASSLQVPARVAVRQAQISLQDLVQGPLPEGVSAALAAQRLARAPRIGETLSLSRAQIQRAWFGLVGSGRIGNVALSVPEVVTVVREGGERSSGRLLEPASAQLTTLLGARCARFDIRPVDPADDEWLPTEHLRLAVRHAGNGILARRMVMWVDAFEGGSLYRSYGLWFEVACYRQVTRLRRDLARGDGFDGEVVSLEERDVADEGSGPRAPASGTAGLVARYALTAGNLVREGDVVAKPLIRKGESVMLKVASGSVSLEVAAIASADAGMGEVILVQPRSATAPVRARVMAAGRLEVL